MSPELDPNAKHILFITSSRIGDAVLSTGLLNYMVEACPRAKFTICCGELVTSLFDGFPRIERIIPMKKQKYNKHWIDLWSQIVATRFDVVVDLRNSVVSRAIRSKQRFIHGSYVDKTLHKVVQNSSVMKLENPPSPSLYFTEAQLSVARDLIPDDDAMVLGIAPSANWGGKIWPSENFIEIIKWIRSANGFMPRARVAIFAAPNEEEIALEVLGSVPSDMRIDIIARTDPAGASAALARCNFFIGNDSGLMHCAAAVGTPTLGLFGPSYPHIYRPWGAHCTHISTPETFDELIDFKGYDPKIVGCLMDSLSVDMVKGHIKKSWSQITASS